VSHSTCDSGRPGDAKLDRMNPEACTLVAQTIPILLVASVFLDRQAASAVATTNPMWLRVLVAVGIAVPLAAIYFAIEGVNTGGLEGWRVGAVNTGLCASLANVALLAAYLFVIPEKVREALASGSEIPIQRNTPGSEA